MKHTCKKIGAMLLASALVASSAVGAFAASSADANNNTATKNDLTNADIIDTSKTGSLTIHKYDITSATNDGTYTLGERKANGEADEELEETLSNYAISGVEFTYLRLGDVETVSVNNGTSNYVELVYEVPDEMREILGLSTTTEIATESTNTSKNAVDMTAENVSKKCEHTGVYHYTSQQLIDALKAMLTDEDADVDNIAAKNTLEEYVTSNSNSVQMPLTDTQGITYAKNMELGLYLLVETKVPENVTCTVDPWFVTLPFTDESAEGETADKGGQQWLYDMTCYPKNQTGNPTLDKEVRNAYSNSNSYEDKNGTVDSADSYDSHGGTAGVNTTKNVNNTPIVHNIETNIKADDTDDKTYIANRGGYTEDGATASEAEYSSDYTYQSTQTASEGDILDYILVSKLPHISSEATYLSQYTFVDTLSEGIEYNQDTRIAFYANKTNAEANNTAAAEMIWSFDDEESTYAAEYVDITTDTDDKGKSTMTVAFTEKGLELINTQYSDYYVVVFYTATVNSDATTVMGDEGNPNDVVLIWERTSDGFYNTLEDRCYVYTYGLDLTKYFSDDNGDATRVKFNLYNATDAYYVVADETETVDGEKVYYVTGKVTDQDKATQFSPDENGVMLVNGLEADTYQLTELETDDGYSLLKDQIVITIKTATRTIEPAIAGYVGTGVSENDVTHTHTEDCYAVDADGNKIMYTGADGQKRTILVCGHSQDSEYGRANGRTIGKTDMQVSDVVASSATVDDVIVNMTNHKHESTTVLSESTVESTFDSANAVVGLTVTNSKTFTLPKTGGTGILVIVVGGAAAIAACAYTIIRRRKKEN